MLIANSPNNNEVAVLLNSGDCNSISHGLTVAAAELGKSGQWDQSYIREMELLASVFNGLFYATRTAPEGGDPDGLPTLIKQDAGGTVTYHRNAGEADNG
jgi:hypothetical protein